MTFLTDVKFALRSLARPRGTFCSTPAPGALAYRLHTPVLNASGRRLGISPEWEFMGEAISKSRWRGERSG